MSTTPVTCCPRCAGKNIATSLVSWFAKSLEPCDPDNTAALEENQCHDCGASFWTGAQSMKARDRVPVRTALTGQVIDGFRVVTASDLAIANSCISFARCRGSVGGEDYMYAVAGPEVPLEARAIERWAIVERVANVFTKIPA